MPSASPFDTWECWNQHCDRAQRAGEQLRLSADDVIVDALGAPHCPGCRLPVIPAHTSRWSMALRVAVVLAGGIGGGLMFGFLGAVVGTSVGYALTDWA
jgi:hypothetical protein